VQGKHLCWLLSESAAEGNFGSNPNRFTVWRCVRNASTLCCAHFDSSSKDIDGLKLPGLEQESVNPPQRQLNVI